MSGDARERMRRAVRAVRREGRKAAAIGAAVDAVAVLLAVNLALEAARPALPDALRAPVPTPVSGAVPLPATVDASALVAVGAGVATAVVASWLRLRRPTVERFEAINPPVAEALRTARDTLAADREGPMADRLYESVLDRLRECSSLGLLGVRRLAVTLVVIAVLAAANVGVAVVDVGLGSGPGTTTDGSAGGPAADDDYTGLHDPDEVLGDPEDVSTGSEELNASVPARGSGNGSGGGESYSTGGFAGSGSVESQQAGFEEAERLEDAELIREYNLRIREDEE